MKVGILGRNGFIGSALAKRFENHQIFSYLRDDLDIVYHFASPSSQILFNHNIDFCFRETINSFLDTIQFCRNNKIKLVYPSSATVYNKATTYARCKSCLEEIHQSYGGDVLGLRIFAGYGPGETHKMEYSSIVWQFCYQIKHGIHPVIWGDGEQTRDFIYIDDIVESIIERSSETGIIDIGSGVNTSFNEIIRLINLELKTDLSPIYIPKPDGYIQETLCSNPIKNPISIAEGIRRICQTV